MLRCDSYWFHHPIASDSNKYPAISMCVIQATWVGCAWVGWDCEVGTMRSGCCVIKRMLIVTAVAVVTEDRSCDLSLSQEDKDIEEPRWRVQVGISVPHGTAACYPGDLYWTGVEESINSKQDFSKNRCHEPIEDLSNPGTEVWELINRITQALSRHTNTK